MAERLTDSSIWEGDDIQHARVYHRFQNSVKTESRTDNPDDGNKSFSLSFQRRDCGGWPSDGIEFLANISN